MLNRLRAFFIVFFISVGAQHAIAHPHVWITAKAKLLFDGNNSFTAIQHQWVFDAAFSAYATVGLDKNGDGEFTREELAKLAQINVESIADIQYFTIVKTGDEEHGFRPATDYWLEYENGQLTLFYTLPFQEPLQQQLTKEFSELNILIFDPMYFANVEFAADNPIKIDGPVGITNDCTALLARPGELDPKQTRLLAEIGPDEDIPPELSPDLSYLANTITLRCLSS